MTRWTSRWLASGALGAIAVVASACTGRQSASRDIIFAAASGPLSDTALGFDLYAMRADGSQLRPLTHGPAERAESNFPEASPDGSRIVFMVGLRTPNAHEELHLINRDGTNDHVLVRLDSLDAMLPTWSPDGKHIAFAASAAPDSTGYRASRLFTISPEGGTPMPLGDVRVGEGCAGWFPSGDALLVTDTRPGGTSRILRVAFPSGAVRTLLTSDSLVFECPSVSPDGTRAAFTVTLPKLDPQTHVAVDVLSMQPYQSTVDGRDLRPLVRMAGYGKDPRWSKDGSALVFLGSAWPGFLKADGMARGDSIEIFTVDRNGEHLRRLTNNRRADIHPSW